MAEFKLPYFKEHLNLNVADERLAGVLLSRSESYVPEMSQTALVEAALASPVNSEPLCEMAKDKNHVVVISSDHTRPVPSRVTMPVILKELRKYNPDLKVTILIATGMHRPTTAEELLARYGEEIVKNEKIVVHDAYNDDEMTFKGILPSGGELWVNKLVDECDLLISEGFIEPHFFAGFSGGRKSVLPGIASKKTVLWNHNAMFIANKNARSGNLENNPIHKDMLFAAQQAGLKFILNVVINSEKEVINAFAGDLSEAHAKGCEFVKGLAQVSPIPADIVVTTNGGYPLDQNIYQTVKGMTAGEACVREGGVVIIASSCMDGHGGEFFYKLLADFPSAEAALKNIVDVPPSETEFDQWEAQILARILCKCTVILVSKHCSKEMITAMHMRHAESLEEAMKIADELVGKDSKITVIPDGIAVIVK
ncbi:MAG: nickel-dependent lactate racemase [Clostridia bacterium]|nr:nickel-dependent lactate racemase [Clostridia bacterium]